MGYYIFNQFTMRAAPLIHDSHSQDAITLVDRYKKETETDLSAALDLFAGTLTPDEKINTKKTVLDSIDGQIAIFEQTYRDMRNKRGEKITAQDIDDIMPYIRLAMLRSLYVQIGNKNAEWSEKLKIEILKFEAQIASTKTEINTLSKELAQASLNSANAIKGLTKTPEYSALETANQKVGENKGNLETWSAVKVLAENTDIKNLKTAFDDEQGKVQEIRDTMEDYYTALLNLSYNPNGEEVQIILGEISFLIPAIERIDSIVARQVLRELKEFEKALRTAWASATVDTQEFMTLLMMWGSMRTLIDAQEKALTSAKKALETAMWNKQNLIKAIDNQIIADGGETKGYTDKLVLAKTNFDKKVREIVPLINTARDTAQELGKHEGKNEILEGTHEKITQEKNEFDRGLELHTQYQRQIDGAKERLDASQKIRINARNLIVRSGPSKSSNPILTPDKKSAIMLQPGDMVTPLLDTNGNVEVVHDGPRDYTPVVLSDGTRGWIALTDKIGTRYKQEYGDINLTESALDRSESYKLQGDGIRLRTGFSTRADIIDVLSNSDILDIHLITNESAGDNTPEGSDMTWKQVEVTYSDGTKKQWYIAERYLTRKEA